MTRMTRDERERGAGVSGGPQGPQRARSRRVDGGDLRPSGFADKNETIDWLRAQGFPFARASWLERIHSNGGRPIYVDAPPAPAAGPSRRLPCRSPLPPRAPSKRESRRPRQAARRRQGLPPALPAAGGRDPRAVPGVAVMPKAGYISFARAARVRRRRRCTPPSCGSASISATAPFDPPAPARQLRGRARPSSHMVVLTDARQVMRRSGQSHPGGQHPGQRLSAVAGYRNPDTK